MPITQFYRFTVAFEGSPPSSRAEATVKQVGSDYLIEEAAGRWKAWENEQPIAIVPEQHEELSRLLGALRPLPDESVQAPSPGCDGAWYSVEVREGGARHNYRWWVEPPSEWARLGEVVEYLQSLAEAPRKAVAEQNRVVAAQFFDRLAARDVDGAMACCTGEIEYSSPFFELRGPHVGAMWQMWLGTMPGLRIVCDDIRAGHEHAFAHWKAEYTLGSSGRRVQHCMSSDLRFSQGKITEHRDRFNLHEWASVRYGSVGGALGGQALFQKWLAGRERARLAAFEARNSQH